MTPEEIVKYWNQNLPVSREVYFNTTKTIVFWKGSEVYVLASVTTNDDKFPPAGPFTSFEHLELAMAMRGFSLTSPLRERDP